MLGGTTVDADCNLFTEESSVVSKTNEELVQLLLVVTLVGEAKSCTAMNVYFLQ